MVKTKIEWADSTWNPITGCKHGCDYCYARRMANRFGAGWQNISDKELHELEAPVFGQGLTKENKAKTTVQAYPYNFEPTYHRYRLDQPTKWVKPRNIFVCSMADLFGDWVPDEWIREVLEAAEKAPAHRYLFLTKNPGRMMEIMERLPRRHDNWWFGSTMTKPEDYFVSSSATALNTFLSIEPLLEDFGDLGSHPDDRVYGNRDLLAKVGWVIIGAETGNRKNRVVPKAEWIQNITDRLDRYGIPVFMKDSLIPIIGEEKMRREFPWNSPTLMSGGQEAGANADQPTLIPGA